MKYFLRFLFFATFISSKLCAQNSAYYLFECNEGNFSFKCPISWVLIPDTITSENENSQGRKELISGKFVSKDTTEAAKYEDCYDGIIFYITVSKESLDSKLLNGQYVKKGDKYYGDFSYMSNILFETENIKGNNWFGIHHIIPCRIYCKSDSVTAIVDGCEFLYFSNNKITVNLATTGETLDDEVSNIILTTFRFND